jgi:signal transduction histidine kinase
MHFSWEERKNYFLIALPVSLLLVGEYYNWFFFEPPAYEYNLHYIRIFAIVAPLHQIITGFWYFLKQSVKFEAESNENLRKLELEHKKQIQVQKMSSLGEMAGGVSHEINNPLMVIIGMTYNLKRELTKTLPSESPAFANIDKIDTMVQRISRIIRALRNFSRNSEHDPADPRPLPRTFCI